MKYLSGVLISYTQPLLFNVVKALEYFWLTSFSDQPTSIGFHHLKLIHSMGMRGHIKLCLVCVYIHSDCIDYKAKKGLIIIMAKVVPVTLCDLCFIVTSSEHACLHIRNHITKLYMMYMGRAHFVPITKLRLQTLQLWRGRANLWKTSSYDVGQVRIEGAFNFPYFMDWHWNVNCTAGFKSKTSKCRSYWACCV